MSGSILFLIIFGILIFTLAVFLALRKPFSLLSGFLLLLLIHELILRWLTNLTELPRLMILGISVASITR